MFVEIIFILKNFRYIDGYVFFIILVCLEVRVKGEMVVIFVLKY